MRVLSMMHNTLGRCSVRDILQCALWFDRFGEQPRLGTKTGYQETEVAAHTEGSNLGANRRAYTGQWWLDRTSSSKGLVPANPEFAPRDRVTRRRHTTMCLLALCLERVSPDAARQIILPVLRLAGHCCS